MIHRSLRLLTAILVALPLGAGGLCCCLLGAAAGNVEIAAAEPAHSCCEESAPVEPTDACPADRDEKKCDCPTRETALLAGVTSTEVPPLAPVSIVAVSDTDSSVLEVTARRSAPHPTVDPPPKIPIYRTLSVLLC